MIPQRIPKYLSPALKSLLCKFSPISETQAVRKLTSPSGTKYMKRLKETEPPRMPDPEYSEMVLSLFRNSLGNLRQTQGALGGNLIPKTKSLYSVDQLCLQVSSVDHPDGQHGPGVPSQSGEGIQGEWATLFQARRGVWLTFPLHIDFAVSTSTSPSSLPCFQ